MERYKSFQLQLYRSEVRVTRWQTFLIILGLLAAAIVLTLVVTAVYVNMINAQALKSLYSQQGV